MPRLSREEFNAMIEYHGWADATEDVLREAFEGSAIAPHEALRRFLEQSKSNLRECGYILSMAERIRPGTPRALAELFDAEKSNTTLQ
jgi:hypothetical protein